MARLNPNIPSPSQQPTSSNLSSSKHSTTAPVTTTQPSNSFEKFLSKINNVDPAPPPVRTLPSTPNKEPLDFSTFSINKFVQPANTPLARQTTLRDDRKGTDNTSAAGGQDGKHVLGYSNRDIIKPGINEPAQNVSEVSSQARHSRMRSCESVDMELEARTRHDAVAFEKIHSPVTDIKGLDNGDTNFSPRINATTTTSNAPAPFPRLETVAHASHEAKLHSCLEVHSLLLARLKALSLVNPNTAASEEIAPSADEVKTLHRHLSRCEQNLHFLLREGKSNEKSINLREACVDILELVTTSILAIEIGDADEDVMELKKLVG